VTLETSRVTNRKGQSYGNRSHVDRIHDANVRNVHRSTFLPGNEVTEDAMKLVLEISITDASVGFAVNVSGGDKSAAEASMRRIVQAYLDKMTGYIVNRDGSVVFSESDVPGHEVDTMEYDNVSCEFRLRSVCRVP
jgi:hypothetical protein